MAKVFLGLGSNIDRRHNIGSGLDALAQHFGELRLSPVYESEAVGFDGSPFLNLVVALETALPVGELVGVLHGIERDHGRVRGEKKFASRTLDIDVLVYDRIHGEVDAVRLPRDEILEHAFVLWPLADLAPEAVHPVRGETYAALRAAIDFPGQVLKVVPFDWPAQGV